MRLELSQMSGLAVASLGLMSSPVRYLVLELYRAILMFSRVDFHANCVPGIVVEFSRVVRVIRVLPHISSLTLANGRFP